MTTTALQNKRNAEQSVTRIVEQLNDATVRRLLREKRWTTLEAIGLGIFLEFERGSSPKEPIDEDNQNGTDK